MNFALQRTSWNGLSRVVFFKKRLRTGGESAQRLRMKGISRTRSMIRHLWNRLGTLTIVLGLCGLLPDLKVLSLDYVYGQPLPAWMAFVYRIDSSQKVSGSKLGIQFELSWLSNLKTERLLRCALPNKFLAWIRSWAMEVFLEFLATFSSHIRSSNRR
jgi:hypothetical protein